MRNALRAYAYEGHDPGAILGRLNDLVESIGDPVLTTLWIGKLDRGPERDLCERRPIRLLSFCSPEETS